ncbi:MAG: DUF374 domain-containing protein [Deltaproteobacteria bacterium]|nr:DUF374 domain-containing protein [Deltaproteobacteria bacterium]
MKKRFFDTMGVRVIPPVAYWLMRLLTATMRMTYVNCAMVRERGGKNRIFAFWHGRLMMMPSFYGRDGLTILVSASRDGELVSRTVARFGIESVRGSTTRGWREGLKGVLRAIRAGRDVAITPDGPKGPVGRAQMGVIQIARATGLPVVPLSFGASKKKLFRAGTASLCRCLSPEGFSYAASLSI